MGLINRDIGDWLIISWLLFKWLQDQKERREE